MTLAHARTAEQSPFEVADLPPLSVTANRLLALLSDPELDICDLAGVIEQDPPLAARIIGLANAAYFSPRTPVVNVHQAILRVLGLSLVRNLALSMVVAGSFDPRRCPGFDLRRYWFEALAVAMASHTVALRSPAAQRPTPDLYYLGGLLHNLGLLFLAHVKPQDTSVVLARRREQPDTSIIDLFREAVDTTPGEAGVWLATRWSLPAPVVQIMSAVEATTVSGDYRSPAAVVRAAIRLARMCSAEDAPLPERSEGHLLGLGLDCRVAEAVEEDFLQRSPELRALASLVA
jgi:HD-like signal output (HDOD) protein